MDEKLYDNENQDFLEEDEETLLDRYLTFNIGDETYGFEIMYVTEIIGIQKITKVPNIPNYIKGIINLRGIIYPVIEIRDRFGIAEVPYTDRTCIILVKSRNMGVGMIVDNVAEVMRIEQEVIFPQPQTYKGTKSKFIKAIAKLGTEVKIILDLEKLLFDDASQNAELN